MADETKVIRIVIDSSKAVDGSTAATRALANMERSVGDATSAIGRMEQALGRMGFWLKGQLLVMAADLGSRLVQMAKQAFEAAAGLGELAEQLGVTARSFQGMQFAAVQAGIKTEELQTSISKFNQKVGEAAAGSKPMLDALNALGVKILDAQGKLRPTETLLQNVAQAIVAIDDPAKRAAASVDFFGKSGAKMQTVLGEIAQGLDTMANKAKAAGAVISDQALAKLDKLSDSGAKSQLQMRALFAESAAGPLTQALDFIHSKLENIRKIAKLATADIAGFMTVAANLPFFAGKAMQQTEREALTKGIASSQADIANLEGLLGSARTDRDRARIQTALEKERARLSGFERQQQVMSVGGKVIGGDQETGGVPFVEPRPGVKNPPPTGGGGGGGESPEKKYAKYIEQLKLAADAQDEMTAAAARGDVAFQKQEIEVKAAQKALEIFGRTLDENDPRLRKIVELMTRDVQGKLAQSFVVATTELQKQNVLLEAEIRLMNEAPDIRAKELALIKARNEAEKAGIDLGSQAFKDKVAAIEQGEKLKIQQDELRKAQELWTEPLKQALRDIQTIGADAFEQLLESGKFSFESLAQTFGRIVRRMAAEFLALATIRPVMSVLVNSVGGPGMASQFGLSAGTSGSPFGGGGIGSLFGGGSSGGGSLFGFLNNPISGDLPSGMYGPPAPGQGFSSGFLGDITWGQGLGAAAGAGMGIMQLINSKSTASTIGGISSIVGAGVSLIPGFGQIAGPLIALAGNMLPGLFGLGEQSPTITNQTYGQLSYGSGGWYTTGGAWGPSANASQTQQGLAGLGGNISNVFGLLGGVKDPSKVWGLSAQSKSVSGKDWSSDSLSTFLVDPSGNQQLWRMNEGNMMDTGSAQVAYRSILEGAVGDISENMRKAVLQTGQTMGGTSLQAIAETIAEVKAFDDTIANLGKTTSGVEQALAQIDEQFAAIYATADKYGFATGAVDAAKQAERLKYATSFADSIQRGINDFNDPNINKLADLDKWRTDSIEANNAILKNVTGSLDQINKIEELYGLQRQQIVEGGAAATAESLKRMTEQSVATIQAAIERLTLGDLANLSPTAAYAGQRASYTAMLAQARAGDANALAGIAGAGTNLAEIGRTYFASGPEYEALRQQIVAELGGLVGASPSGGTVGMGNDNAIIAAQAEQIQTLTAMLGASIQKQNETNDLLKRYVVNQ